jgi:rubrerythrin
MRQNAIQKVLRRPEMKTKGNWVIKTSTGRYWCGANLFDEQIRKAQIYHWKEKAEEQAAWICKRNKISEDVTWEVIAVVEPKELKDTEAEWLSNLADECGIAHVSYVCSVCGYSALNDYRGSSVASKFCPHCGKYMTNHDQPED